MRPVSESTIMRPSRLPEYRAMRKLAFLLIPLSAVCAAQAPVAPVRDVTDTYFGTPVKDPYRYFENTKDAEVIAWIKAQGAYARKTLDAVPGRAELLKEVTRYGDSTPGRIGQVIQSGDHVYYQKRTPPETQFKLYVRTGWSGAERLLVDADQFKTPGASHMAIDYFAPSYDNRYVAVGLSPDGSEDSVLRVIDVATGKDTGTALPRARFGAAWTLDDRILYTRLRKLPDNAPKTEQYLDSTAMLHKIGEDASKDIPLFGREAAPAVAMTPKSLPYTFVVPGSKWLFAGFNEGNSSEFTLHVAPATALRPKTLGAKPIPWRKVFDASDKVTAMAVHGDYAYVLTHRASPQYEVRRVSLASPNVDKAPVVVPASAGVIMEIAGARDGIYIKRMKGGLSELSRLSYTRGARPVPVPLPYAGDAGTLVADVRVPGTAFFLGTWTRFGGIFHFDPAAAKVADTGLQPQGPFDSPKDLVSTEVEVTSHDGTKIPLSIVHKRGVKLDGSNPTLLEGYGAYGYVFSPYFRPSFLPWYQHGGVYAVAHVRGGGENGKAWHDAGKGVTKSNTWRDAIACAEYLIKAGYTRPDKLAIWGTSAGGIFAGRSITERPDLFAAAIMSVPSADTLRTEFGQNPLNTEDYGTVKEEASFRGLLSMSSYANVKDGVKYPAVLATGGVQDPRVDVWMPAKFVARMQAATTSGKPVLFRVEDDAGHGMGATTTQVYAERADYFAFLFWQMGLPAFQPKP